MRGLFGERPSKIFITPEALRLFAAMLNHQENHLESQSAASEAAKMTARSKHCGAMKHGLTKDPSEKYKPISIRLHPKVMEWAKAEAEKRGVGYQSIINETLLQHTVS